MDPDNSCLQSEDLEESLVEPPQIVNSSSTMMNQEANDEKLSLNCFICEKSTEEDRKLKTVVDKTLTTMKTAVALRKIMKTDKFNDVTNRIFGGSFDDLRYHPSCHRQYTAVKRPKEAPKDEEPSTKKPRIETRLCSALPKSDQQGLLKGKCIFCGKDRKKKRGKEETRLKIATKAGCETLVQRAHLSKNDRIKSLIRSGVDLIAKEAEYHKSCRWEFMHETEIQDSETSRQVVTPHHYHKKALVSLCTYIRREVIQNERCVLVSSLLDKYKAEYSSSGGDVQDVVSYKAQNLLRKVCEQFGDEVSVKLADNRRGNYLCSVALTEEQVRAHLYEDAKKHEENEKLRWAALHLRSQIMKLPKSKTPNPATVHNLKERAPEIPEQLDFFFRSLLGGLTPNFPGAQMGAIDRKITAMASDAIFNVTRGTVKPWKHIAMGLGLASLTGSKLCMQILNRAGHSISYSETKGLETEFAYSVASDECDAPNGICLLPDRGTACVWDNNDANVETLDGKETLHATVGHTYQNILQQEQISGNPIQFREGQNRRTYVGSQREIPPFRKPLKKAKFISTTATATTESSTGTSTVRASAMLADKPSIQLKVLDLYWFWELRKGNTPLYAGFISKFINDPLPLQKICYMDPISRSPTNNDVVRETMIRTMNVAKETGQDYAVVTYDLAIALKAYSIQALETPLFDKLLIMLGNFHIELAFYGAVGTLINESGIEFILTEADILAEGSMMGFIKGKFYNRCTRIHELLANVLEQKLYERFLQDLPHDEYESFQEVMNTVPLDPCQAEAHLSDPIVSLHLQKYEEFFHKVIDGDHGPTPQFWGIYIFLINRLHRELQRCIKTNDVQSYINVFPAMLEVFFSLNRPNYARWGTLFLQKLTSSDPQLCEVLEKGAFSIRRTKKDYSRSAIDLSLEQTVNRDAASSMKGIVPFRNSENAMRRWFLTMTQRAMAVTELRTFSGLELGETATAQYRPYRIKKDNMQMVALHAKIEEFCNPFTDHFPSSLVNLVTGRAATKATESYLLEVLKRGQASRERFQEEWNQDSSIFLKPVKRTRVQNFASENEKKKTKSPVAQTAKTSAESLRDMFLRMIVVVAENTSFDLKHVLTYPITTYPLSLAHSDGAHLKTAKSALLKMLEELQTETLTELPDSYIQVYDGGLLIHSVLSQTNVGASYGSIARTILSMVCSGRGHEVHVCFDKYVENSIKDSERKLRGAVDSIYFITGPDQTIRQSVPKLLNNGVFKNELAKFLLREWGKDHYSNIFGGKTLVTSYGGECLQYIPNEFQQISVTSPAHLQADHEEADTLMAFHIANITTDTVVVRASDTDVLVILIGTLGQQCPEVRSMANIIMDCGNGNSRRYINVTNIADILEERKPGLPRALPGYHAFTGCDFTSAFYRKGKVKPLEIVEKDKTGRFVDFFISMGEVDGGVDMDVASEFVCRMYAQGKIRDVNEARYSKLMQMTGKVYQENPLANIKRINCALLPPSRRTLEMKIRRAHYVTVLWNHATTVSPDQGLLPTHYGWSENGNLLQPTWFEGPAIPDALFTDRDKPEVDSDSDQTVIIGNQPAESAMTADGLYEELNYCDLSDGEPWSEDSDSERETDMDY